MKYFALCTLCLSIVLACSIVKSPQQRYQQALQLALGAGWQPLVISTPHFSLQAFVPEQEVTASRLTVYIEGDGFAWRNRNLPSDNPTPVNPIALQLALRHGDRAAAYLGRPCQYIIDEKKQSCAHAFWTNERFSEAMIAAINSAIEQLKSRFAARELVLVGYSGGGAVAVLLAARRQDVVRLVTVAGNLDHAKWTSLHEISSLTGSLNPSDYWRELTAIPQLHLVGEKDTIITPAIAAAYAERFPETIRPLVVIVPSYTHDCCWVDHWPALLNENFQ